MASMAITLDESKVLVAINPLDPSELFVDPGQQRIIPDLPSVMHLVPAEWQSATVHRFEPTGPYGAGAWVLRNDVPEGHVQRVWGHEDHWGCVCTACEAYRAVRLDLVLDIAVDTLIADALED